MMMMTKRRRRVKKADERCVSIGGRAKGPVQQPWSVGEHPPRSFALHVTLSDYDANSGHTVDVPIIMLSLPPHTSPVHGHALSLSMCGAASLPLASPPVLLLWPLALALRRWPLVLAVDHLQVLRLLHLYQAKHALLARRPTRSSVGLLLPAAGIY